MTAVQRHYDNIARINRIVANRERQMEHEFVTQHERHSGYSTIAEQAHYCQ